MMVLVSMPTILKVLDSTIDVSIIYSMSEEEEKETKTIDDIKLLFSETIENVLVAEFFLSNYLHYNHKKYSDPNLHLYSPPPEHML